MNGGSVQFIPAAGMVGTFSGVVSGGCPVCEAGQGVAILSATNTYTSTTAVYSGALQADSGVGLPTASVLVLLGGVLQSTCHHLFGSLVGHIGEQRLLLGQRRRVLAGAGNMTVNIGNGAALHVGTAVGSQIVGTLQLSSTTATAVTTFQNKIDLNGANRSIGVDDNVNTTADYAIMSGVISNSNGTAGIDKLGTGTLVLQGSEYYNGTTTISGGNLLADFGAGIPSSSFLCLDGGVFQPLSPPLGSPGAWAPVGRRLPGPRTAAASRHTRVPSP